MKVILLEEVKGLGAAGEVVEVAPGYGRNYLFPRHLAVEATPERLKAIKARQEQLAEKKARELSQAQAQAERLASTCFRIPAKAGGGGKLFGAVTTKEIARAIAEEFNFKIDKRKIELPEPLKNLGNYEVTLRLHPQVTAKIQVEIIPA